jgi:phospholipid-translocating ATPase
MVGFATIYTSVPVFQLLFDQDLDESLILSNPQIYKELRKGRSLGIKKFFEMLWWAIYQGSTIIFLSTFMFKDSFANIVLGTYSSLIVFEWLLSISSINTYNFKIFLMQINGIILYFVTI